jgi:hypothetical protein
MVGDIILKVKTWVHQNIKCIHNYKPDRIGIITGLNNNRICSKCSKFENA